MGDHRRPEGKATTGDNSAEQDAERMLAAGRAAALVASDAARDLYVLKIIELSARVAKLDSALRFAVNLHHAQAVAHNLPADLPHVHGPWDTCPAPSCDIARDVLR